MNGMPVRFIADIGSNHNRSLERAIELIDTAKKIGCWAVKFQLFKASLLWRDRETIDGMKKWELPEEWIPQLSRYSRELGLKFIMTPFYLDAVDTIASFVDLIKIGSYEILWLDLIKKAAETQTSIILSTGMATYEEVHTAIETCTNTGNKDIALLHCNSEYPAQLDHCYLQRLEEYSKFFQELKIREAGWSDHTGKASVIYAAIAAGATLVEFHLDTDGQGQEYTIGHCWLPTKMAEVILTVKEGELARFPNFELSKLRAMRTDPKDGKRGIQ